MPDEVGDHEYQQLLEFRTGLRRFLHWSEQQAAAVGLTAAQHQLLLAIRGHRDHEGPTIGNVADALLLKHHSAVGLVDRSVAAGLIERRLDPHDHRVIRLALTRTGSHRLLRLSRVHLEELRRAGPRVQRLWANLGEP